MEPNVWRNYQTKLLGGGLLLIAIIIIAALLSHSNHSTPVKQEVELTLQPSPSPTVAPAAGVNPPVAHIEINKDSATGPETLPATQKRVSAPSSPAPATAVTSTAQQPTTDYVVSQEPTAAEQALALQQSAAEPPAVSTIKPVVTSTTVAALPRVKTLAAHPVKAKKSTVAGKPTAHSHYQARPKAKLKAMPKAGVQTTLMPVKYSAKSLRAIPAQRYTIQLLGVNSKRNALVFIKNNHLQGKVLYYQTMHQSNPWHVVIYGEFQTKAQAHAAMRQLPAALVKLKPFVRSYAEVHAAVNAH